MSFRSVVLESYVCDFQLSLPYIEMPSKRKLVRTKSTRRSRRRSIAPSRRIDSLDLLSPDCKFAIATYSIFQPGVASSGVGLPVGLSAEPSPPSL